MAWSRCCFLSTGFQWETRHRSDAHASGPRWSHSGTTPTSWTSSLEMSMTVFLTAVCVHI